RGQVRARPSARRETGPLGPDNGRAKPHGIEDRGGREPVLPERHVEQLPRLPPGGRRVPAGARLRAAPRRATVQPRAQLPPPATAPWLARWLSRAAFELIGVLVTDLNGRWETVFGRLSPLNLAFQSGDRFAIAAHPEAERLDAPFGIAPGDTIPTGSYTFL